MLDNFYEKDYDELKNLSNDDIIQMLQSTGIINSSIRCTSCNDSLSNVYYASDRHPYFRCNKRRCKQKKISLCKNSIFSQNKISYGETLKILYYFSCRRTVSDAVESLGISKPTVVSLYKSFRASLLFF